MRLQLTIISFFFLASAPVEPRSWQDAFDLSKFMGGPVPYSLIGDILKDIIDGFKGEKTHFFERIEIDDKNRFENVTVESNVPTIELDLSDKLTEVNIKNLTAAIKLVQVTGLYTLEDLVFPGGLTIYGNGKFTIRFQELNVFLLLHMKYSTGLGHWKVKNVATDASLGNSLIEFKNLMNGEPLGDFIHNIINEIIPVLVDLLRGLVEENKEAVASIIEEIMKQIMP